MTDVPLAVLVFAVIGFLVVVRELLRWRLDVWPWNRRRPQFALLVVTRDGRQDKWRIADQPSTAISYVSDEGYWVFRTRRAATEALAQLRARPLDAAIVDLRVIPHVPERPR